MQVIFGMAIVLLQFIAMLFVVILGFAMALFPLVRDVDNLTFEEVLLLLFKTLHGDVEAFDEFSDSAINHYSPIGNMLLVVYLVVMTIMLLNLLIAVLSTAHAKVEMNTDKELEVSKVRVVEHYRLIVALDILPAPFNLVPFALNLPFLLMRQRARQDKIRRKLDQTVGQISFWLVLSPVVVTAGTLLWITSSVFTVFVPAVELVSRVPSASSIRDSLSRGTLFAWFATRFLSVYVFFFPGRESLQSAKRVAKLMAIRLHLGVMMFCALGAPLCLLILWLREPCLKIFQVITAHPMTYLRGESTRSHPVCQDNVEATGDEPQLSSHDNADAKVHSILESTGVGASRLQKYLENPMLDPEVRPDEVELAATVEHIKLLRNLLEKRFADLGESLEKRFDDRIVFEKKIGKHVDCLEKKVGQHIDFLETNFNSFKTDFNSFRADLLEILRAN